MNPLCCHSDNMVRDLFSLCVTSHGPNFWSILYSLFSKARFVFMNEIDIDDVIYTSVSGGSWVNSSTFSFLFLYMYSISNFVPLGEIVCSCL